MSAQKLLNAMRMMSSMANQGTMQTAIGKVNAFDPSTYQVQVLLQAATDDAPALATGWIPLASPWTGDGWGMFVPASTGDLILVFFQDGSLQNPIAGMRIFYDEQLPTEVQGGEMYLIHKSGSCLKFLNDGTVELNSNSTLKISSDTKIDLTAPIVNIDAEMIKAGPEDGVFQPVLLADSSTSINLMAT